MMREIVNIMKWIEDNPEEAEKQATLVEGSWMMRCVIFIKLVPKK